MKDCNTTDNYGPVIVGRWTAEEGVVITVITGYLAGDSSPPNTRGGRALRSSHPRLREAAEGVIL